MYIMPKFLCNFCIIYILAGERDGTVVKVLRYKPEGRWSIPDGVIGIFH